MRADSRTIAGAMRTTADPNDRVRFASKPRSVGETHAGSEIAISVVIPARNEAQGLAKLLPALKAHLPDAEIIVSDDGSTDDTVAVARSLGARVVSRPYGAGNGAAIKAGARAATHDWIVFMDGDGQHLAQDIPRDRKSVV